MQRSTQIGTFAISLASACVAIGCTEPDHADSVKIGLLLPFTGDDAAVGGNLEAAARMVVDRVNMAGGIFDATGHQLELVTFDTHSDVERGLDAVSQLLDDDVKVILGPERSELALSMLTILRDAEVVFISPVVSSGTLPDVPPEHAWYRFAPSVVVMGRAIAYDALDQQVTRLAVLVTNDDYHTAIGAEVADRFVREGGEIATSIELSTSSVSFGIQITELFGVSFDAIALIAPPKTAAQVVNEIAFLGHGQQFQYFLPPSLETDVFLQNTSAIALEGSRGVAADIPDFDPLFAERFRHATADEPLSSAYFYYDAMSVLALALATGHRFELQPSRILGGGPTVVPLAEPRGEIPYEELVAFIRWVSQRNGIRTTWDEIERSLDLIRNGEAVFYHGITGTMVQSDDGQRSAARTTVWTIENGTTQTLEGSGS